MLKRISKLLTITILAGGLSLNAMDDDTAQLKVLEDQSQELQNRQNALQKELIDLANLMGPDYFKKPQPEPRISQLWQEITNVKSQKEAVKSEKEELQTQIGQKKNAIEGKK